MATEALVHLLQCLGHDCGMSVAALARWAQRHQISDMAPDEEGLSDLEGRAVMLIGHEKGHDTQSRIRHNFGMGKPEGYRKAIRLMELADRFGLPVVTLVDTSGA